MPGSDITVEGKQEEEGDDDDDDYDIDLYDYKVYSTFLQIYRFLVELYFLNTPQLYRFDCLKPNCLLRDA